MEEQAGLVKYDPVLPAGIEKVVIGGDLSPLTTEQRVQYYHARCRSLGLNPLTEPFGYIKLNNRLVLYAKKDATDQLRKIHGVSLQVNDKRFENDLFIVQVSARDREGRIDEDIGFAPVANLKGDNLGNAILKAVTKAKRRVTLSICGLGMLDESEIDSIKGAVVEDGSRPLPTSIEDESQDPADQHPSLEQVKGLRTMVEHSGIAGEEVPVAIRKFFGWSDDFKMTLKNMTASMTLEDYHRAYDYFGERMKEHVEAMLEDVPDGSPPGDEISTTQASTNQPTAEVSPTSQPGPAMATADELGKLKFAAQKVGDDAYANVQESLRHYPNGVPRAAYEDIARWLKQREAEKKAQTAQAEQPLLEG